MVHAAQGRVTDAKAALEALKALASGPGAADLEWRQWPALFAASGCLHDPELRPAAAKLLEASVKGFAEPGPQSPFEQQVAFMHALAQTMGKKTDPKESSADLTLAHWVRVPLETARSRWAGTPRSYWSLNDDKLECCHGGANDVYFFKVPLLGDFEVECEVSSMPQAMGMAYAGRWISINSDGETYGVHQHPNLVRTAVIRPALQKNSEWLHLRLVVKGRQMQMFVNGQKIHEEYLPADPDPWLSIVPAGWGASRIRNVKITGNPTVPESLSLSTSHDLRGWLNYHSGEADLAWSKDRSNIVGRRNAHSPAKRCSLLQYHRPISEDGTIDYEFYYDPGRVLAHPALDQVAFLVAPNGVQLQRFADSPYELTAPVSAAATDSNLNLKANSWNQMRVTLKGDQLSLHLNEKLIHQAEVEAGTRRMFGLFHFADETEARVRNVRYRGGWQRQLSTGVLLSRSESP